MGQATIMDIAKALNISTSTVSRALKDYPGISDTTKRKVKELAEKMNYRPNALARSLRKRRSTTIGVIIPEVVHFFFSTVISGIEEVANERGYTVILSQTNERVEREKSCVETMLSNQIDGLLVSYSKETEDFTHFSKLLDQGYPLVFFDRAPALSKAVNVTVDDFQGAYDAVCHLIDQGYKRIVHLSGPKNLTISRERLRGYQQALSDHGLEIDETLIVECRQGTEKESQEIASDFLSQQSKRPDAFFASNDLAAVGALLACKEAGLDIPENVGIVGFSNWQFCTMLEPALSSVNQPGFDMGRKATELLINLIEGKSPDPTASTTFVLPTTLLIRKSSRRT